MKKPEALRAHLLRWLPALAENPERLQLFVDGGRVVARAGASLSFEYRYALDVLVTDYAGDRNLLVVPILAWIARYQPDLFRRDGNEPFAFEAEILESEACDISIKLDLTELVRVTPRADGGFDVETLDEPDTGDHFAGVCGVNLWEIFLQGDLAAHSSDPAYLAARGLAP